MEGRIPGAPQATKKRRAYPEQLSQERLDLLAAHVVDEPRIK
ncbi:MAG TPA: hypothetical protein PK597_04695 [Oscillospiraceae bacterium]|nr:hypothetical protein [Oscillospiraceae bacterium]